MRETMKEPIVERILLTVPEAAKRLGISQAYAYRLVAAGAIKSVRLAGAMRVPIAEIDAYIERLMAEQQSAGATREEEKVIV